MNSRHLILATLSATLLITACKKDDDDPSSPAPTPSTPNAMLAIFDDHVDDAAQTFTVDAAIGGWVNGNAGTMITFPANAFRTQSGAIVTGNVQVELVEAFTVGKMIWMNKQTLGNDNGQLRPLVSGGQYYLNVTQGGQQLKLAPNAGQVYVPAPNGVDPSMELFSGTVASDGTITWDPFAPIPGNGGLDSSNYSFPNDSLGWVNCDYYMGAGTQTTVQVTCPAGYDGENTMMWLVFPDQNSVTGMHHTTGSTFSTGGSYTLPVGMNLKIVAISNSGGTYTGSITTTTVTAGMNPTIAFSATTLAQFEADVNAL